MPTADSPASRRVVNKATCGLGNQVASQKTAESPAARRVVNKAACGLSIQVAKQHTVDRTAAKRVVNNAACGFGTQVASQRQLRARQLSGSSIMQLVALALRKLVSRQLRAR